MIGVYATVTVQPEHVEEFLATVPELVAASRKDIGNVNYDFGTGLNGENQFVFYERWESQADLEEHLATEHFRAAAAVWEPILAAPLEVRTVNLYTKTDLRDLKTRVEQAR